MYKHFTTRFGVNAVDKIKELRREFPNCSFAAGIHKDIKGIFAFRSSDIKEYGSKNQLDNGDFFWDPTADRLEEIKQNLSSYKSDWQERILVKLMCGIELHIFPASAIPKKVLFSRKQAQASDIPFDPTIPYGKLAYDMYDRSQRNEEVQLDDPMMMKLIKMALVYSYTLPEPLWDALGIINYSDIDKLFASSLGMDWELLQQEVKKSNAASQPMTGATVA